jgi:hypothetical protein
MTAAAALVLGCLLFVPFAAAGDASAERIKLPADLQVGQRLAIDIEKQLEVSGGGVTWTIQIDAEVMAAAPEGTEVRWTYRKPADQDLEVMGFERSLGAGVGEFSALVADTTLVFRVGRGGAPLRLVNGDEFRAAMARAQPQYRTVIENWLDYWSSQPGPAKFKETEIVSLTAAGTGLAAALQDVSDDQIAGMLLKDAHLIYLLLGQDLAATGTVDYADELPNPFGGPPSRATGTLRVVSLDRDASEAVIELNRTYKRAPAGGALAGVLKSLETQAEKTVLGSYFTVEFDDLAATDRVTFTVNLQTGLPKKIELQSDEVSGRSKRKVTEHMTIAAGS